MMMLYEWEKKEKKIETQYGVVSHIDWLRLEKDRIMKNPKRVVTIKENMFSAALFVNPIV